MIHNLTHRHFSAYKHDVGTFVMCGWRFTPEANLFFRPDLDGAAWHKVPDGDGWEAMLKAANPQEAMKILRSLPCP